MPKQLTLRIWTDGGARGNPGPAGIGARIVEMKDEKQDLLAEISEYIGHTTNNQAEYKALLAALTWVGNFAAKEGVDASDLTLQLFTDSELLAYQINGKYKVKNVDLKPLYDEAKRIIDSFNNVTITPVRREKNQLADKLVNQAIDTAFEKVDHVETI